LFARHGLDLPACDTGIKLIRVKKVSIEISIFFFIFETPKVRGLRQLQG
jgi:hypothetical protein